MNDVEDKATTEWLNSQKASTKYGYRTYWKHFLEYAGMTGDQILADRENDTAHKWEKLVLQFKQWMIDKKRYSQSSATTATIAVRGFFAFHYQRLEYRRAESKKLKESKRKTEDYFFSLEDLRKMADVANLKEKYVLVAGKSFGLRASDFLRLTRGDVEPYLDRPVPISIGKIDTSKENVSAYPFIDSDAQPVIKLMLQQMNRQGRIKETDRVLSYKWGKELSQTLKRLATKAGINVGNKQVRFHCLRKFLIDNLSRFMSESKWKQIVGKAISEGAYVSADSLREDYQRVMNEITFAKMLSEDEIELRAAQRALEMQLNMAVGIPQHNKEQMLKKIRSVKKMKVWNSTEKEITERIKQLQEQQQNNNAKPQQSNNNCADGENCQRIVSEADLGALLAQGWRVAAVLPSGKIVVSNE
jgi:integrase